MDENYSCTNNKFAVQRCEIDKFEPKPHPYLDRTEKDKKNILVIKKNSILINRVFSLIPKMNKISKNNSIITKRKIYSKISKVFKKIILYKNIYIERLVSYYIGGSC